MKRVYDMKNKMKIFEENFGRKINNTNISEKQREELINDLSLIRGEVNDFQRELKEERNDRE